MVANELGMLMWSTDQTHKERLAGQSSTMDQRPHENPLLAAKGHMEYRLFRAKMREQEVVRKEKTKLKAQIGVEEGKDVDSLVGQVMGTGELQPPPQQNAQGAPQSQRGQPSDSPKLKAQTDWVKLVKGAQRAIIQDAQLFLKFMADGNVMTKDPMSGANGHLRTNIKECYEKVLAQSKGIAELMLQGSGLTG